MEVFGPILHGNQFNVKTVRSNPADPGAVTGMIYIYKIEIFVYILVSCLFTGSATYNSFLSSIIRAQGKGLGVHLC